MSVATYFLRPQLLRRRPEPNGAQALSALIELVVLLTREQASGGMAVQKIGQALQTGVGILQTDLETRLRTSGTKIKNWFQPILDTVQEGVAAGEGANSLEGFVKTLDVILQLAQKALDHLTADELATQLNQLCDIIEHDLGLSQRRLETWFSDFIEATVVSLTADYLAGNTSPDALRQFHIGAKISALRGQLLELTAQIPEFDRHAVVLDLAQYLKDRDWDATIGKMKEYGDKVIEALQQLPGQGGNTGTGSQQPAPVSRSARILVQTPGVMRRDVGVPDATQYSWYASWFFESRFGFEAGKLTDRYQLNDAALGGRIAFKNINPRFLEDWAHWSAVSGDAIASVLHFISRDEGDEANNWTQFAWHLTQGLTRGFAFIQDSDAWVTFFKIWENYIFKFGLSAIGAGLAGLENTPDKFVGWLHARFLPNFGETILYGIWLEHLRQFTLSLFTLVNHDSSVATSENYKKADGFTLPFVHAGILLGAWLPGVLWEGRKHYGFPFSDNGGAWASMATYWAVGGIGLGFVGGLSGWALAGAISGKLSDDYWGKSASWQLPLLGAGLWPMYTWLLWEGDTDKGKWGLDNTGAVVPFDGYQDRASSPYKLPFPADTLRQCVQGHHGVWSHNGKTEQLYALDFAFDYGGEILAMRGGTIVDWQDNIADDTDSDKNYVIIRHDDPTEAMLPNPVHDRAQSGPSGAPHTTYTYAEYMHGRTHGVRLAFAARGIPESAITGSRVQQGDLIMLAGNTGRSAYNHLHVHVMASAPGVRPYITIPWVIQDVSGNGVPKSFKFYKSANTRRAAPTGYSVVHPHETKGVVSAVGNDWVQLNNLASKNGDRYKDCYILVQSTDPTGQSLFQYRKITAYNGEQRRATVDSPWDFSLAADAQYEIGAKPYTQATELWRKGCTYLADRDDADLAMPFEPDGRAPDTAVSVAHYTKDTFIGHFTGAAATDNFVFWKNIHNNPTDWVNRNVAVMRDNQLLLYRQITAFDPATLRIEVNAPWGIDLDPATDQLHLGGLPYNLASESNKTSAFLANVQGGLPATATDFADNRKPYVYLNFMGTSNQ